MSALKFLSWSARADSLVERKAPPIRVQSAAQLPPWHSISFKNEWGPSSYNVKLSEQGGSHGMSYKQQKAQMHKSVAWTWRPRYTSAPTSDAFEAMPDQWLLHRPVTWVVDWGKLYLWWHLSRDLAVKVKHNSEGKVSNPTLHAAWYPHDHT